MTPEQRAEQAREKLLKSIPLMGIEELNLTEVKICRIDLPCKKPFFAAIESRKIDLEKEVSVMAVSSELKIDY